VQQSFRKKPYGKIRLFNKLFAIIRFSRYIYTCRYFLREEFFMVAVTFKGNPVTLVGNEVKVGDTAPDFKVLANDLSEVTLADTKGYVRIISVVPSLDTGVCDAQTRRFNEEAAKLDNVKVLTISVDLPFAQKRWCGANGIENVQTLSDHRDVSFGQAYGVLIKELRLLARAVFVIDSNDKVTYVEYVNEVTDHPNYEAAIEAAKAAK
jgi:thioredoxin-dependent peroxiredoxin